jgi:hypothetical protein
MTERTERAAGTASASASGEGHEGMHKEGSA